MVRGLVSQTTLLKFVLWKLQDLSQQLKSMKYNGQVNNVAPEVLSQTSCPTRESDVYSLGRTLWWTAIKDKLVKGPRGLLMWHTNA